jgi:four helix bundle protein
MSVKNYRDLIAWQKAMDLVAAAYVLADALPQSETFGLAAQLKRAPVSGPVNIAEGEGRGYQPEFRRYLRIAHGSLREIETEVLIAIRLGFTSQSSAEPVMGRRPAHQWASTDIGRRSTENFPRRQSPTANSRLAWCQLPTANCQLPTADYS